MFWCSGDYKEGYYIGVEVPEDDPQAEKPFYGPNLWPSSSKLSKLVVSSSHINLNFLSLFSLISFL